jgi:hypothetical protein
MLSSMVSTAFLIEVNSASPAPDIYAMAASLTLPCIKSSIASADIYEGVFIGNCSGSRSFGSCKKARNDCAGEDSCRHEQDE